MSDILLDIAHPVASIHYARPGARPQMVVRRILTPARIAVLPERAMRVRAVPCMEDPRQDQSRASTYEHDGRLWWRMSWLRHEANGFARRVPARADEVLAALSPPDGDNPGWNGFPIRTPLAVGFAPRRADDTLPLGPGGETDAPFRAALTRYLAEEVRICGEGIYLAAGLPCLTGTKAPTLAGAGPAWGGHTEWRLTRHDRVEDHVRYVGRLQRNDERARFRYLADLVAEGTRGIDPDDRAIGAFANGLPHAAFLILDHLQARVRKRARPEGAEALTAARDHVLPWAALGALGAVAPGDWARCIRACLAALDRIPAGEAKEVRSVLEWRAFAEEVALPSAGCAPEVRAEDVDALEGLVP